MLHGIGQSFLYNPKERKPEFGDRTLDTSPLKSITILWRSANSLHQLLIPPTTPRYSSFEVLRIFGGEETGRAWECINYSEHKFESLPESQWRYFVIAFTGSNATIVEIERSLSIASCDIKIAFTLMKGPFGDSNHPTLIFDPGRFFYLLQGEHRVLSRKCRISSCT
jgi:hypothetical protein